MVDRKKGAIAAVLIAAGGIGSLGISSAFAAQENNTLAPNIIPPRIMMRESLIEALATRFGVSIEEVRAVFEEEREAREERRRARANDKCSPEEDRRAFRAWHRGHFGPRGPQEQP